MYRPSITIQAVVSFDTIPYLESIASPLASISIYSYSFYYTRILYSRIYNSLIRLVSAPKSINAYSSKPLIVTQTSILGILILRTQNRGILISLNCRLQTIKPTRFPQDYSKYQYYLVRQQINGVRVVLDFISRPYIVYKSR